MQRLCEDHYRRYVKRLGKALLASPTIINRDIRGAFISDLPLSISSQMDSNLGRPVDIVEDLIKICANNEDGEIELFRTLEKHEKGTYSYQAAQSEWQKIRQELDMQDILINCIRCSDIQFIDLHLMFETVIPEDYVASPSAIETLVTDLWEIPISREPLSAFLRALQLRAELPDNVRRDLEVWYDTAFSKESILDLPTESLQQFGTVEETRIIVTIELGKQDLSKRLVSLWISDNGVLESLDKFEVDASQLEAKVSNEIDTWTVAAPAKVIEFYLPKSLLNMPVDTWEMRSGQMQQRFIERYRVIKGILERQEARTIRTQIEQTVSMEEKKRLVLTLENQPLLKELVRRNPDWEDRWQQLNNRHSRQFIEITLSVMPGESLPSSEDKFFALFAFSPLDVASCDLDDPIGKLMLSGVPIMAWVRSIEVNTETTAHLRHLLFDMHSLCAIRQANDIVDLMHQVCRQPRDLIADPHNISHKLNLIVDNPEIKLPHINRVTM